jgi:dTMP kinase
MTKTFGKLIALEGIDGSGKGTQIGLLINHLTEAGFAVAPYSFPRYGNFAASFVEAYLRGEYGPPTELDPRISSFFYAHDRRMAKDEIKIHLEAGHIVVCDRYVGSNLGHQGGKILGNYRAQKEERIAFFKWLEELEYGFYDVPRPDISPTLFIPPKKSEELVMEKNARPYLQGEKLDGHEKDANHLTQADKTFRELTTLFPEKYVPVECFDGDRHRTAEEIHELIWKIVAPVVAG